MGRESNGKSRMPLSPHWTGRRKRKQEGQGWAGAPGPGPSPSLLACPPDEQSKTGHALVNSSNSGPVKHPSQ